MLRREDTSHVDVDEVGKICTIEVVVEDCGCVDE